MKLDIRGRALALAFAAAAWLLPFAALAQSAAAPTLPGFLSSTGCHPNQSYCWQAYSQTNPMPVSGTFSATLSGFAPNGNYASLTAGASSTYAQLPAGSVVVVYNQGTSAISVKLGTTTGVTASATSGDTVSPGGSLALTVGSNTYLAAISLTATSSPVVISGGSGLWTGSGGGGGSGGAVTIADGASVTLGQKSDAIWTNCNYNGTQSASLLCVMAGLYNASQAQLPTGSNDIGKIEGAQTQGQGVTGGLFRQGCRAATAIPSPVSDGQAVDPMCSVDGKRIVKPFAPSSLDQIGQVSPSANTSFTAVTGWTTPGAGQYAIVTGYNCERTDAGTTAAWLTFNNGSASGVSIVPLPPNYGGAAKALQTPWKVYAAATLPAFETSASGVTAICSVEGYNGTGS